MVTIEGLDDLLDEFEDFKQTVGNIATRSKEPIKVKVNSQYHKRVQKTIKRVASTKGSRLALKVSKIGQEVALGEILMRIQRYATSPYRPWTNVKRRPLDQFSMILRKSSSKSKTSLFVNNKGTLSLQWFPYKIEYRDPSQSGSGDPIHFTGHWWAQQGSVARYRRFAVTQVTIFGRKYAAGRKGTKFEGLGYEPMGLGNREKRQTHRRMYKFFHRQKYPSRIAGEERRRSPHGKGYDPTVTIYGKAHYPVFYELLNNKTEWRVLKMRIEKALIQTLMPEFKKK